MSRSCEQWRVNRAWEREGSCLGAGKRGVFHLRCVFVMDKYVVRECVVVHKYVFLFKVCCYSYILVICLFLWYFSQFHVFINAGVHIGRNPFILSDTHMGKTRTCWYVWIQVMGKIKGVVYEYVVDPPIPIPCQCHP
jgi:hypothetical protein